jgi:methyl-accepting chemotaxis protein
MSAVLRNMKLSNKLLLAPVLVILFMVGFGIVSFLALRTIHTSMNDMYTNRFAGYRGSVQIMRDMKGVQTNLYKLIGWANANYEAKKIEELGKEQIVTLKKGTEFLKMSAGATGASASEKKLSQEALKLELEYAGIATDMIDMMQSDMNAATMFMKTLEDKFQALDSSLEALCTFQTRLSEENFRYATATYNRVVRYSIIILVCAVIGSLLVSVAVSRIILVPVTGTLAAIEQISSGDLTRRIDVASNDELGRMAQRFNEFVEQLQATISAITGHSNHVAESARQLSDNFALVASNAEKVAAEALTVATAGEEMAATSGDIAQNCHIAAGSSSQAADAALDGTAVVGETVTLMTRITGCVLTSSQTVERLGERSDQIGAIIGTIEDIADQTNLLALNAAIEAARAGEQGRGFAVVADEVRALAERTTRATREIGEMIKTIQKETKEAVTAMGKGVDEVERGTMEAARSGQTMQLILEQVNALSMQMNQIATAAEEQTATTNEISGNMQTITGIVHQTATNALGSTVSANRLTDMACELQRMMSRFRVA